MSKRKFQVFDPEETPILYGESQGISVNVIWRKGEQALVEWYEAGNPRRAFVLSSSISDDGYCSDPASGIPYGADWESLIVLNVTPQTIALELRKRGIWTADDLRTRPGEAIGALQTAYGLDLAALLRAATKES